MSESESSQASGAPARTVLEVDGLSVDFGSGKSWVRVVDDVSFTVGAGEIVGLVGESGSGKTVTCLSITQLLPPRTSKISGGAIRLGGVDLTQLGRRALEDVRGRDIGMIFQEPMTSLNPAFRVGDQIAQVVRRHRGVTKQAAWNRAVEMLDAVGIPSPAGRARSYPHELSGGMRQRVMIAMALSCEPQLLIADEPTTALDVTVQAQVLDVLRNMGREFNTAILFVTHDLGVVAELCDRVVVMYAGQIVEQSGVDPIFEAPQHPYTGALLRAMPQIGARRGRLPVIPGTAPRPGLMPTGCRFYARCEEAEQRCTEGPITLSVTADGRMARCIHVDGVEQQDQSVEVLVQ
ncbi:MAG: ABC transporter ATP-binding protein [Ilumatobacteraceae bacterium]